MANRFTVNKEKAAEEKAAKLKAQNEKEILDAVKPINVVETMAHVDQIRLRDGGVNGGKPFQAIVNGECIAADSEEGLETIKQQYQNGIVGDGMLHKRVVINGVLCECVGRTVEELEEDILNAKKYAKQHSTPYGIFADPATAKDLVEAGYEQNDLKEVDTDRGRYFISFSEKRLFAESGKEIASLEDYTSPLTDEDIERILTDKLSIYESERNEEDDDEWDDDDYDDESDDYDDDGDFDTMILSITTK